MRNGVQPEHLTRAHPHTHIYNRMPDWRLSVGVRVPEGGARTKRHRTSHCPFRCARTRACTPSSSATSQCLRATALPRRVVRMGRVAGTEEHIAFHVHVCVHVALVIASLSSQPAAAMPSGNRTLGRMIGAPVQAPSTGEEVVRAAKAPPSTFVGPWASNCRYSKPPRGTCCGPCPSSTMATPFRFGIAFSALTDVPAGRPVGAWGAHSVCIVGRVGA